MKYKIAKLFTLLCSVSMVIISFASCNENKIALDLKAKTINGEAPIRIGEGIFINKAEAVSSREFKYKLEVDTTDLKLELGGDDFKDLAELYIAKYLDNNELTQVFEEMETTLIFSCYNKYQKFFFDIIVPPSQYTNDKYLKDMQTINFISSLIQNINPHLPLQVNDTVTFESTRLEKPRMLAMKYIFAENSIVEMDEPPTDDMIAQVRDAVRSNGVQILKDKEVILRFDFYKSDDTHAYSISLTPNQYLERMQNN